MRLFVKQVFYLHLNLKSIRKNRLYLETSAVETLKPVYEPSHGAALSIQFNFYSHLFTRASKPVPCNGLKTGKLRRYRKNIFGNRCKCYFPNLNVGTIILLIQFVLRIYIVDHREYKICVLVIL